MKVASLAVLPCAFALCACAMGPDFTPPPVPSAQRYVAPGDVPLPADQNVELGKAMASDWWIAFHSPRLDGVIKLALANNQTIAAAKARVAQAREGVVAAEGALLPQVWLDATAGRQKYGAALFGPLNFTVPPFTYYTIGPDVTFPLDLFGGDKRTAEEKEAYQRYRAYQRDAAALSLTANVAAQALDIAAAHAEITAMNGIIADDQRNVALVQTAISDGSGTRTQLLSAQSQLASDRTLLPAIHQRESVARHALAILVGKAPDDWSPPDFVLDDFTLPRQIPVSLPSDLVHSRPDIRASEAELHMASAAIGVATANLYPKVDLTGALTQEALTPGGLFNSVAAAWSVAANLAQPLFDGGQLSAKRRAAVDAYQATLADYRQTVLTAFGQVANRLQALANDSDQLEAERTASQAAIAARDLVRRSYAVGNSGVLDVLDAERRAAQAQLGLSRAKAKRLMDTARLFLALGGTPIPDTLKTAMNAGERP